MSQWYDHISDTLAQDQTLTGIWATPDNVTHKLHSVLVSFIGTSIVGNVIIKIDDAIIARHVVSPSDQLFFDPPYEFPRGTSLVVIATNTTNASAITDITIIGEQSS